MEYQHIVHLFEPIYDARSRVLILGSFPSVMSRADNFYYGNPQNRFWRVLAALYDAPVPKTNEERRTLLLENGVAIWDVIYSCDIRGSSDSSIKNAVPTDIRRILDGSRVGRIFVNGATAGELYRRHQEKTTGIAAHVLPSTSPANAAWTFERLCDAWGVITEK